MGGSREHLGKQQALPSRDCKFYKTRRSGFRRCPTRIDHLKKERFLTIKAEHKENQDQKDDKGNYIRRERRYGSFSRTFDVSGIDENAITAVYNNGILELTLPKLAPVVPQSRQIAIG